MTENQRRTQGHDTSAVVLRPFSPALHVLTYRSSLSFTQVIVCIRVMHPDSRNSASTGPHTQTRREHHALVTPAAHMARC